MLGYYQMLSGFIIQPYSDYWCNDLPRVLNDCLVLVAKSSGFGNCVYSTSCDTVHAAICEVWFSLFLIFKILKSCFIGLWCASSKLLW